MTTIRLFCQGAAARAKVEGVITAGAVGIPVEITCDSAWDGLMRTIVFRTAVGREAVAGVEDSAVVAPEVLVPGLHLYLALEGRDVDGSVVIPTNWADCGVISSSSAETDEIEYPSIPEGEAVFGGYYIPWVDEDGNLSWTPSKSGMPAVISVNIKGDPGYTPVKGTDYWTAEDLLGISATDVFNANPEWEQGTINTSGADASSTQYIRTKPVNVYFVKSVSITIGEGYSAYLFQYAADGALLSRKQYTASVSNVSVAEASFIRLVLRCYPTLADITPDDGSNVTLEMLTYTVDTLSKAMVRRRVLTAEDDLDSILQAGNYQISSSVYPAHMPDDASGSCLLSVFEYGSNMVLQIISSPNLMWYRRNISSGFYLWKQIAVKTDIDALSDQIAGIEQAMGGGTAAPEYEAGTISTSSGNNASSDSYIRTSGYLAAGLAVSVSNMDSTIYIFKYSQSKEYIGYVKSDHVSTDDCAYIRMAFKTPDIEAARAAIVTIDGMKPAVKSTVEKDVKSNLMASFKRFAVIGDSMAAGHLYPTETSTSGHYDDKSVAWGTFIARKLNTTYFNFALEGATAKSFVTGIKSDDVTSNGDNNISCALDGEHDVPLYIIGLGLNDNGQLTIGSMDDVNFSDYTQNGDTYFGWYGRIIQQIVGYYSAKNLPVTLVMITPPRWSTTNSLPNAVAPYIRDIYDGMLSYVEDAGCHLYLMDLHSDNSVYFTDFITGQTINNHYASIGYNMCAMDILNRMNDIIWENPSAFKRIDQNPCNTYITSYANPDNFT